MMVTESDWYGLLIVLYLISSLGLTFYGTSRVQRWMGLCCPYCDDTFIHSELKDPRK
jgi:hypothetical protein